jgi:hypothetical protein
MKKVSVLTQLVASLLEINRTCSDTQSKQDISTKSRFSCFLFQLPNLIAVDKINLKYNNNFILFQHSFKANDYGFEYIKIHTLNR